ncbi:MAG: hypothetical protein PHN56_07170 [Candidatus Nanoarchaeia archaeon]|nr:hypothetical protein [Candidatus Nanoarchaeia archaeon]
MLTTKRKVSVISTYDNAIFYLDENQDKELQNLEKGDRINIDGNNIFYGNIRGIYTIEQWNKMNPVEHSREEPLQDFQPVSYSKQRYLKILQTMIDSFKGHFKNREMPEKSKSILNKMLEKYSKAEKEPEDKKFTTLNIYN